MRNGQKQCEIKPADGLAGTQRRQPLHRQRGTINLQLLAAAQALPCAAAAVATAVAFSLASALTLLSCNSAGLVVYAHSASAAAAAVAALNVQKQQLFFTINFRRNLHLEPTLNNISSLFTAL